MEHYPGEKGKGGSIQLTSFSLHILAMALMLCDHLWGTFLGRYDWLSWLGRIAFPIFAFLLAEGFSHTKDLKKYRLRLVGFAVLSEIPFNLMMGHAVFYPLHQNVLWTFLLATFMLGLFRKISRRPAVLRVMLYFAVIIVFYLLGMLTFVDYYGYGLLMVALFWFTRWNAEDAPLKKAGLGLVQAAGLWWISDELIKGMVITLNLFGFSVDIHKQALCLLALPLIWLYRGKQGPYNRAIRNVYYWFYPVHLLILGGLITFL